MKYDLLYHFVSRMDKKVAERRDPPFLKGKMLRSLIIESKIMKLEKRRLKP